ncbi:hypothetical protein BKA80DRAFT_306413 [Phyllosticta citrichinensis]
MIPSIFDEFILNTSDHFNVHQGDLFTFEISLLSSGNTGSSCMTEIAPDQVQDWVHWKRPVPEYTSILSNRDAKQNAQIASAAKRDSSSMKSLVALSIIFAPPSCIATIASMPMLSWQPGQFWIFWAYTVPITGVVIIIWIFYMFFINQRNRDSDNRIAGNEPKPRGIKNFWGAFQKGSQPPTPSADGQKGKDIADASREEGKDLESGSPGEALPPEETRRVDERPSLRQILHLIWLFLFWQ